MMRHLEPAMLTRVGEQQLQEIRQLPERPLMRNTFLKTKHL